MGCPPLYKLKLEGGTVAVPPCLFKWLTVREISTNPMVSNRPEQITTESSFAFLDESPQC
eukprot:scaffold2736_cov82-Skeletonema_dohrnii-CCMP3373.AAC.12